MSEFESIINTFAIENDFSIRLKSESNVELMKRGLRIFITHDERENEIYIDLDVDSLFNTKNKGNNSFHLPLFLSIEFLYKYLELPPERLYEDKSLPLKERITKKCHNLKFVWDYLQKKGAFEDILLKAIQKSRETLQQEKEIEKLKETTDIANLLFKEGKYKETVQLLLPNKTKLNPYHLKLLGYAIEKIKGIK